MKRKLVVILLTVLCISVTACGAGNTESADSSGDTSDKIDSDDLFSERDMAQYVDVSEAEVFEVKDGENIVISEDGFFVITGEAKNCTVRVEAGDEDKVQLVLKDLTIENEDFPAIYVVSADKCFVTTADGNSSLSVTGTFTTDGETNTDAVIFSKQDLTLNGEGSLEIICQNANGVSVKDDLKITGGIYTISSREDAVEVNDSLSICGGLFNITSKKDGFNCGNDDDNTAGSTYISGGEFYIDAKNDGIQSAGILQIDEGSFDISSAEGLEATYVKINGGKINITASDDGINATNKCNGYYDVAVEFNGGETTITMGDGDVDGIDANGSIYVNAGTININVTEEGMAEAFDFDNTAELNGGTVYVNGEQITEITTKMPGGMGGPGFGPGQGHDMGKGF